MYNTCIILNVEKQIPGSMAYNAMKKRAIVKPLSPNVMNGALHSMMLARRQPKWSNVSHHLHNYEYTDNKNKEIYLYSTKFLLLTSFTDV